MNRETPNRIATSIDERCPVAGSADDSEYATESPTTSTRGDRPTGRGIGATIGATGGGGAGDGAWAAAVASLAEHKPFFTAKVSEQLLDSYLSAHRDNGLLSPRER